MPYGLYFIMSRALALTARYAAEGFSNAKPFAGSLKDASSDPEINRFLTTYRLYSNAMGAQLGIMLYDMAVGKSDDRRARRDVGSTAYRVVFLGSLADDVVDERPTSVPEKFAFIDSFGSELFGRSRNSSADFLEEACYCLARKTYKDFLSNYGGVNAEKTAESVANAVKSQIIGGDPDRLLEIDKVLGSTTADSFAVLTELRTGGEYPHMRKAARKFGEYCQFLDNLLDVDNDMLKGVNTYPAIMLRREGPSAREEIGRRYLAIADDSVREGFSVLENDGQRAIYQVLKNISGIKYRRLLNRYHS